MAIGPATLCIVGALVLSAYAVIESQARSAIAWAVLLLALAFFVR